MGVGLKMLRCEELLCVKLLSGLLLLSLAASQVDAGLWRAHAKYGSEVESLDLEDSAQNSNYENSNQLKADQIVSDDAGQGEYPSFEAEKELPQDSQQSEDQYPAPETYAEPQSEPEIYAEPHSEPEIYAEPHSEPKILAEPHS